MVARFRASVARITFGTTFFSCLGVLEKTRFFSKNVFLFLGVEPSKITRVSGMRRVAAGGAKRAI